MEAAQRKETPFIAETIRLDLCIVILNRIVYSYARSRNVIFLQFSVAGIGTQAFRTPYHANTHVQH